jgi:hypothetical protein
MRGKVGPDCASDPGMLQSRNFLSNRDPEETAPARR